MKRNNRHEAIGERIRSRREDIGMTQSQLAHLSGYTSQSSITRIEGGLIDLPQSKIIAIAEALRTTPEYIAGWESEGIFTLNNISPITTSKIPMLGRISCGVPTMASEERDYYVDVGTKIQADFCLQASGDSMINARIQDGDIVFIKQQNLVSNGDIAAVLIGDEVTLKRVYYYPDQNELVLQPENPKFATLRYRNHELEQVKILGKAVAFQSDVV